MMDLGKVKEALIAAREELPEYSSAPLGREPQAIRACRLVSEALAELEKPAKTETEYTVEDQNIADELYDKIVDFDSDGVVCSFNLELAAQKIHQYTESYHAKKCAECKHSTWCSFRGVPITTAACENCSTYPCDKCAKNETCDFENYATQCNGKFLEPLPEVPRA